MRQLLPNLKNYLKQATAIGVVLTIAVCLAPEAAQARRFSGNPNANYTFDIDPTIQDIDGNLNNDSGKFPGAIQNLTVASGATGLISDYPIINADLTSSRITGLEDLPVNFVSLFDSNQPSKAESPDRLTGAEFVQQLLDNGVRYDAVFNELSSTSPAAGGITFAKLTLFVASANPNNLDFQFNPSSNVAVFTGFNNSSGQSINPKINKPTVEDFYTKPVPENPMGALLGTATVGTLLLLRRRAKHSSQRT